MRPKLPLGLFLCLSLLAWGCGKPHLATSSSQTYDPAAFGIAQAMRSFYGNYDPVRRTSTISFAKTVPVRTTGEPMTVRPLFHSFSDDSGSLNFVLVTYAVPKRDEEYYCHACAPTIGMAVFSRKGSDWMMAASNAAVTDAGEFGKPPTDIGLVQAGANRHAVMIDDVGEGNGETTAVLLIMAPWSGNVNLALERIVSDDDAGACEPDGGLPCYGNHRSVRFLREGTADYYELQLSLTGTDLPLSDLRRHSKARPVLGDETLRFEDGRYQQISREGDLTTLDRVVAKREGLK